MKYSNKIKDLFNGHRIIIVLILCLFGLSVVQSRQANRKSRKPRPKTAERVYLRHADVLRFDQYGPNPTAQVLIGHVSFKHQGATLTCDSAYFYQESNSFRAFGHVKMHQGDTLSLFSDYAYYDGNDQMAEARYNVILKHKTTKLYTDSLNFDRLYGIGYFFEGGKMIDKNNVLVSDWGEYDTGTRQAVFNYNVNLKNPKFVLTTDTLHYDTKTALAHIVGPSKIVSGKSTIYSSHGYYNTNTDYAQLYGRSRLVNEGKELIGDSLYHDDKKGISQGFRNVIYTDTVNKNRLTSDYFWYDENNGFAFATNNPVLTDFSQKDTLYMHADTMKVYTFNMSTDSVWRRVHCYNKVRAFRTDVQAVCDSLIYNTKDSCLTLYKDPIAWNDSRQILGEEIQIFMKDSTIDHAHVINQALSIEQLPDSVHFNQIASKDMFGFFENGEIRRNEAVSNVQAIYYFQDDKDSSLVSMYYIETDTMRMYLQNRQLQKIWTPKQTSTMYPVTQVPPSKSKLPTFAWFDYIRPINKDDIFLWRGKKGGTELKQIKRRSAPLQHISDGQIISASDDATPPNTQAINPVDDKQQPTSADQPPSADKTVQTDKAGDKASTEETKIATTESATAPEQKAPSEVQAEKPALQTEQPTKQQ